MKKLADDVTTNSTPSRCGTGRAGSHLDECPLDHPVQIQITARAARDIQRLPEKIATACVEFIFGPRAVNPRRVGKPLRGELAGLRSARRGDYRVIYAIVEDEGRVDIVHIDRRSDIYR